MAEAGPSGTAQDAAAASALAQPAADGGKQKQAQLVVAERQYQQGVQAIRVRMRMTRCSAALDMSAGSACRC